MGWSFYNDPANGRARVIRDVTNGFSPGYVAGEHRVVGNTVYQLVTHPDGQTFIAVTLIKGGGRDSGWGYKGMDESAGPCVVDCPLWMLDAASPPPPGYAVEWRQRVRAYHAAKAAQRRNAKLLKVGDPVMIHGKPYTIVAKRQPRGWIVADIHGNRYRATRGVQRA